MLIKIKKMCNGVFSKPYLRGWGFSSVAELLHEEIEFFYLLMQKQRA
jgi:hypothetical protein